MTSFTRDKGGGGREIKLRKSYYNIYRTIRSALSPTSSTRPSSTKYEAKRCVTFINTREHAIYYTQPPKLYGNPIYYQQSNMIIPFLLTFEIILYSIQLIFRKSFKFQQVFFFGLDNVKENTNLCGCVGMTKFRFVSPWPVFRCR